MVIYLFVKKEILHKVSLVEQPLPTIDFFNEMTAIKIKYRNYKQLEDAWMSTDFNIIEEFCYYSGFDIDVVLPIVVALFSEVKRLMLEGYSVTTDLGVFSIRKKPGGLKFCYKPTDGILKKVKMHLFYDKELNFPTITPMEQNASVTRDITKPVQHLLK